MTALAALALTVGLGLPAFAEPPIKSAADSDSRVHRLEIWNGPVRSVHFFSQGVSPGDETALRDLTRAENDLALTDEVLRLRRSYVTNERILEHRRGELLSLWLGDYGLAYAPSWYGYPAPLSGPVAGFGPEGVLRADLGRSLAQSVAPEAVARTVRSYDLAAARVADSKVGSKIGLVKGERIVGPAITLVLKKDNEKITGNLVNEDNTWITVETAKETITVRKADVDRMIRPKTEVMPATK